MKIFSVVQGYWDHDEYKMIPLSFHVSKEEADQKRDEHMSMPDLCYYYVREYEATEIENE